MTRVRYRVPKWCAALCWGTALLTISVPGTARAFADERLPSLFRGVVVADAKPAVVVVTIDEESAAYAGGLRSGDVITTVEGQTIASMEAFARQSQRLAGTVAELKLTVQRAGQSAELLLSLFSARLLEVWGERFVPNLELRFREPSAGYAYWNAEAHRAIRAQRAAPAIEALETALHYQPDHLDTALSLAGQWNLLAQSQFVEHHHAQGIASLQHAINLYQRLLTKGIAQDQLVEVKAQLQRLVDALKQPWVLPNSGVTGG